MNPGRVPVRIWRADPKAEHLDEAMRFEVVRVRHVHGVYRDECFPRAIWVTTGDSNGECYLWRTDDEFKSVQRFGDGTQRSRAVHLIFTKTHVVWFMDSNLEQNYLMSLDRSTGKIEQHQPVDSSVWYGKHTDDGYWMAATTVEEGPGVMTEYATVMVSQNAFDWTPVRRFRKDFWRPRGVFKYGVVSFAAGPASSKRFWISGEGLWGLDGVSAECALS